MSHCCAAFMLCYLGYKETSPVPTAPIKHDLTYGAQYFKILHSLQNTDFGLN